MKKKQVLKMIYWGEYKVILNTDRPFNKHEIYHIWREPTESGVRTRRSLIARYDDLASCLYHLAGIVENKTV